MQIPCLSPHFDHEPALHFFGSGINLHDLVPTKVACITRTPYNDKQYEKYND